MKPAPARRPSGDRPEQSPRGKPKPRPIGDKCNPLCPYFRCAKNALRITTVYYRGRPMKVAMCSWTGDRCLGAKCRYAVCTLHAMLPDGRCQFAVEATAKSKKRMKDFEEELREMESEARKYGEFEDLI
ncbi:hypothetical protein [Stetteria hydrogenophila]